MEPIEQDFEYLADSVRFTFTMVGSGLYRVPRNRDESASWVFLAKDIEEKYATRSTRMQHPRGLFDAAHLDGDAVVRRAFDMDTWVGLYVKNVEAIVRRWMTQSASVVEGHLNRLNSLISEWSYANHLAEERELIMRMMDSLHLGLAGVAASVRVTLPNSIAGSSQPAEPSAQASKPKSWPDLKTLALFHALRYDGGEKGADLHSDHQAEVVATHAGFTGIGSGKRLRSHFHVYRNEAGRIARGKRSTEVLKRYEAVIPELENGSKALMLAQREQELVLSRVRDSAE